MLLIVLVSKRARLFLHHLALQVRTQSPCPPPAFRVFVRPSRPSRPAVSAARVQIAYELSCTYTRPQPIDTSPGLTGSPAPNSRSRASLCLHLNLTASLTPGDGTCIETGPLTTCRGMLQTPLRRVVAVYSHDYGRHQFRISQWQSGPSVSSPRTSGRPALFGWPTVSMTSTPAAAGCDCRMRLPAAQLTSSPPVTATPRAPYHARVVTLPSRAREPGNLPPAALCRAAEMDGGHDSDLLPLREARTQYCGILSTNVACRSWDAV